VAKMKICLLIGDGMSCVVQPCHHEALPAYEVLQHERWLVTNDMLYDIKQSVNFFEEIFRRGVKLP
jgi:hypothetical protein